MFFLVIPNSSNKRRIGGAALIRGRRLLSFFVSDAALIRVNTAVRACINGRVLQQAAFDSLYMILL